jgi:prevent-host-death family protein
MARYVNIQDAKQNLADLVLATEGGAEFVIAQEGRAAARLVPVKAHRASEPQGVDRKVLPPEFEAADVRVAGMQSDATEVPRRLRKLPG